MDLKKEAIGSIKVAFLNRASGLQARSLQASGS